MVVPEPVMRLAIKPSRRQDIDRLAKALDRFRREDPTFRVSVDPENGQTLIEGMGQLHLEVYVERLRSEFDCECDVGHPEVTYLARPTCSVDFQYIWKKQTGGPGQFAKIEGRLQVTDQSTDYQDVDEELVFEDQVVGGRIAKPYLASVRKGLEDSVRTGPLAGCRVVGVHVIVSDGDQHEQDSSEVAFRQCASAAMREVIFPQCGLELLEPIMDLETDIPAIDYGSVTSYLARHRGAVLGTDSESDRCVIRAEVPLSKLFEFSNDLRSLTRGEGTFVMQPKCYRRVPQAVQDELLRSIEIPH